MFGLSLTHTLLVAVIALIFIGPDQLPEVARMLGRFINELKRTSEGANEQFRETTGLNELDKINEPNSDQPAPPAENHPLSEEIKKHE